MLNYRRVAPQRGRKKCPVYDVDRSLNKKHHLHGCPTCFPETKLSDRGSDKGLIIKLCLIGRFNLNNHENWYHQ